MSDHKGASLLAALILWRIPQFLSLLVGFLKDRFDLWLLVVRQLEFFIQPIQTLLNGRHTSLSTFGLLRILSRSHVGESHQAPESHSCN